MVMDIMKSIEARLSSLPLQEKAQRLSDLARIEEALERVGWVESGEDELSESTTTPIIATISDASEILGISKWSVYRWCESGALKKIQKGRHHRIFVEIPRNLYNSKRKLANDAN